MLSLISVFVRSTSERLNKVLKKNSITEARGGKKKKKEYFVGATRAILYEKVWYHMPQLSDQQIQLKTFWKIHLYM